MWGLHGYHFVDFYEDLQGSVEESTNLGWKVGRPLGHDKVDYVLGGLQILYCIPIVYFEYLTFKNILVTQFVTYFVYET